MSKKFLSISMILVFAFSLFSLGDKVYADIIDFYGYGDEAGKVDYNDGYVSAEEMISNLPYKDVDKNSWDAIYVYESYYAGIMKGKSKDTFDPTGKVTMAELATISAKLRIERMVSASDIVTKKGDVWYMPYVRYCYENGVYNDKNVKNGKKTLENCQDWNRPAKRSEVAGMLANCDNFYKMGFINPDVPMTDINDIDSNMKFSEEILTLYRAGVAVGDKNMRFHPNEKVTRAEVAAMVTRILYDDYKIELPKG